MKIKTDDLDVLNFLKQCNEEFISNFIQQCKTRVVNNQKWAREDSLEFVPYSLMASQVRPEKLLIKEPTSKINVVCYSFTASGSLMLIEGYGSKGSVKWLSYIDNEICIEVDDYGDLDRISTLLLDNNGRVEKSITIQDNDYFVKRYIYEKNKVVAIESIASNGAEGGTMLKVHYIDGKPDNLSYQWKNKTIFLLDD